MFLLPPSGIKREWNVYINKIIINIPDTYIHDYLYTITCINILIIVFIM
jgi:hypothetical protein